MGRICPILNHPLIDGVLVNDDELVHFIQKRNVDFLPEELVCRSCKNEITKLYNKKLKRAIELRKLQKSQTKLHPNSISSIQSSRASSVAEHSITQNGLSRDQSSLLILPKNDRRQTKSFVENNNNRNSSNLNKTADNVVTVSSTITSVQQLTTSLSNKNSILQENRKNQQSPKKTIAEEINLSNVTVRKRTIKDFLTAKPKQVAANVSPIRTIAKNVNSQNEDANDDDVVRRLSQQPTTSIANNANGNDDDGRRLSQQPTTSRSNTSKTYTTNSNKRPISSVIDDSDDDDERLSLNAFNGTRLPNIQPLPPKRKPVPDRVISMARDIMDEYIKDVTGG